MRIYDLIIIGGGPAGITAAIYAIRKRIKTLMLTKDFIGQVGRTGRIDNYPGLFGFSGMDLIKRFEEHLKKFEELEIKENQEVIKVEKTKDIFLVKSDEEDVEKEFFSKTIIVATGRDPRPLEVPGEKEFIGKGVTYCSICDAPFFKDKAVAVVGGGNSAFEASLDLAKYAKRIFIFEQTDKIIADEILQEQVKKQKKIEVFLNKEIKKIIGQKKVQALIYYDLKTGKTYQVPIDGVFIQIGSVPATGFLKGLVEFNESDEIKADLETCATSCPGIFAAGDINDGKWKQIIIAAGEGAKAALAVHQYLQSK